MGRDKVASHPELKEGIEDTNNDISDINFLYSGIIKYNWQKKYTRLQIHK